MKKHTKKCATVRWQEKKPETSHPNIGSRGPVPRCDCDGYHTFDELYDHRITLYIALCRLQAAGNQCDDFNLHPIWRSKRHSDGELCFGTGTQFVLGINVMPGNQITYHLPISRWDETDFAETLDKAPEWDRHTSDDVIKRLKTL